jgi:ribosomal protein S6--L-glutamate ligase
VRLYFILVRRVPPVPSPVLVEAFELLERRGFEVHSGIPEEMLFEPDRIEVEHDLYLLKSHTELSLSVAGVLHARGARLLNPYPCCIATQNKIVAARRLRAAGVRVPRCWVTGDLALLEPVVAERPLIVKPYMGHRGNGVHVIRNRDELAEVPCPAGPVLIQEHVEGSGEDLKVYVVGDEVFAVRKPFSASSFAEAGRPCSVDPEVREIALRCGRATGLGLYGIDLIESKTGPVVVDLNHFPGYKGVPRAAALIADYVDAYARGRRELALPERQASPRLHDMPAYDPEGRRPAVAATSAAGSP